MYKSANDEILKTISSSFVEKTKKIPIQDVNTSFLENLLDKKKDEIWKELNHERERINEIENEKTKTNEIQKDEKTLNLYNKISFIQNTLTSRINKEEQYITTDTTEIQRIIKEHYENMYTNKLGNLEKNV